MRRDLIFPLSLTAHLYEYSFSLNISSSSFSTPSPSSTYSSSSTTTSKSSSAASRFYYLNTSTSTTQKPSSATTTTFFVYYTKKPLDANDEDNALHDDNNADVEENIIDDGDQVLKRVKRLVFYYPLTLSLLMAVEGHFRQKTLHYIQLHPTIIFYHSLN